MFNVTQDKKLLLFHGNVEGDHTCDIDCFCKPMRIEICDELTADVIKEELDKPECIILK